MSSKVIRAVLTDPHASNPKQALDRLVLFAPDGSLITPDTLVNNPSDSAGPSVKDWAPNDPVSFNSLRRLPDGTLGRWNQASGTTGATFVSSNWTRLAEAPGFIRGDLPNVRRKLLTSPSTFTMVLAGDSTSFEPNDPNLYSPLRTFHVSPGEGLAGVVGDTTHIKNGGNNGVSLVGWLAGNGTYTLAQLIADAPNLVVLSFGINDVRLAVDTYQAATLTALLTDAVERIRAALPNTDIVLRIPNPLLTENVGGQNFVKAADGTINPPGGAQRASDVLHDAYVALVGKWPNVVVWDAPRAIFGRISLTSADTNLMSDQLHPSPTGYQAIADTLVRDVIGIPALVGSLTTSLGGSYGKTVGEGLIAKSTTPWLTNPAALDNPDHFRLVASGRYVGQSATTLEFRADFGWVGDIQIGDIVRIGDGPAYKLTVTPVARNSGGAYSGAYLSTTPDVFFSGQTIPANTITNGTVKVYRELDQGDLLIAKLRSSLGANRHIRVGRIAGGGTNFATINAEPGTPGTPPSGQWAISSANDKLYIAGYAGNLAAGVPAGLSLAAYSLLLSGASLQLSGTTIDFTPYVGRICVLVGAHASETGEKRRVSVDLPSIPANAGMGSGVPPVFVDVPLTDARAGDVPMSATAIKTLPPAAFSTAGLFLAGPAIPSGNDTVRVPVGNSTAAAVDRAAENWTFFIDR